VGAAAASVLAAIQSGPAIVGYAPSAYRGGSVAAHLEIVIDASDAERLAAFWAAALGYKAHGAHQQYRSLVDPDGSGPKVIIQQVAEPKAAKNRVHLDVHAADVEAEVGRLARLGAARLDERTIAEAGTSWVRMSDPDGNEFCVCAAETSPASWPPAGA
jgi:predicted enzyme related to lactoylglutathione lyase